MPDMANQQQSGTENERVEMLGNISVRPEGVGELGRGKSPIMSFKEDVRSCRDSRALGGAVQNIYLSDHKLGTAKLSDSPPVSSRYSGCSPSNAVTEQSYLLFSLH